MNQLILLLVLPSFLPYSSNRLRDIRLQGTMRDTCLWRQAEWLFLLSLSSAVVAVTTSTVLADQNSALVSVLERQITKSRADIRLASEIASQPMLSERQKIGQFASHETTTANVFDDLCCLHGNLLDSSVTFDQQNQGDRDKYSASIDVLHEIFDPSFGLVPYISYTVRVLHQQPVGNYVYALQVNHGKMTSHLQTITSRCENGDKSSFQLLQLVSVPSNVSWTMKSIPEDPTTLTLRLLRYSTETSQIVSLVSVNHTILPGCYLKLGSSRGIVSSTQIPSQFDSLSDHLTPQPLGCWLLLQVPAGSSAELTLRKLKLLRPHSRECHEDSQLQLATSSNWDPHHMSPVENNNSWHRPSWPSLFELHRWQVARTFCGKIQDYAKNLRTWRTFDPWVLIRFRSSQRGRHHVLHSSNNNNGAVSSFFALKFNVLGPCLNLLLTERSKTIELSDSDLAASVAECTFRIHVPYGYRIHLSVQLLVESGGIPSQDDEKEPEDLGDEGSDNNALLLQSGRCQVAVQTEDITGHRVQCLHPRRSSTSFTSASNLVKFQAMLLHQTFSKQGGAATGEWQNPFSNGTSPVRLRVHYSSEADGRLTNGCDQGILADEMTCIWLHQEPLTWHEAEAKCSQLAPNGHLVAITSPGIQQAVDSVVTNSAHYEPSRSYWIGGSDQKQETIFEWSSGATFDYAKWFTGWTAHQLYNAQPSDDGISNQDCIEIRQSFGQPGQSEALASGFFWNDRDCSVANQFICQKPRNNDENDSIGSGAFQDVLTCNRTEELNRLRTSTIIQSPFFPRPYPNSVTCIVDLSAPIGFRVVFNFDFFDLEEEEDCNYDVLELVQSLDPLSISVEQRDSTLEPWRHCGNWNSRLKLLRWKSSGNRAQIRFTSDSSYSGNGFQLVATIERADLHCPEAGSIFHHGRCYLIAPYPEIGWLEAHQMCRSLQSELVLPDSSSEEVRFLMEKINANQQLNTTAFYWIGQTSRFQLSIPHSVDAVQQCPSLRTWSPLINTTLNLEPCGSTGGYICEKLQKSNHGMARNSSIESREGEVKSPNHPSPYGEGNHFRLHIRAPNSSSNSERLVVRFKQIDIEFQENCLYDYIGLQSRENGPMHKICGQYTTNLERLDFVSDTCEVWLTFHSDFSVSGDGFHAVWSTVHLLGCPQQSIDQPEGQLFSPYYPTYYLPYLNCTYHLIAPEGERVWIKFHVLEIGLHSNGRQQLPCRDEYVRLVWGADHSSSVILCGSYNLSRETLQWISDGNRLSVQLVSVNGKQGRGFHASYRFVPVPTMMKDTIFLDTEEADQDELLLVPFNYPHPPPGQLRQQITLLTRHGYSIRHQAASWLKPCSHHSNFRPPVSAMLILRDAYNNNTEIELCYGNNQPTLVDKLSTSDGQFGSIVYQSYFNSMTLEFVNIDANWSAVFGRVRAVQDASYVQKVSSMPDDSPVDSCDNNPCQNNGICALVDDHHYCQCNDNWKGLFCSLTLCQLSSPCLHGTCTTVNETQRCQCDPGFTGYLCDTRLAPCDLEPCGERGKCVPSSDSFICQCHPWWQGPRCETRWLHLPYKPLSQRMLEEPFWLGLMTIAVVLIIIAIVWCAKRHFAEKFERFVSEELERGKLVEPAMLDWSRGRHLCHRLSMEANAISRPVSPQTSLNVPVPDNNSSQRHLLGWSGFRKPSLLSITSLISPSQSHTSVAGPASGSSRRSISGGNRGQRGGGRTFSLDDLFRLPKRSPSPSKRGSDHDVASQRRELERQQILQRLIASQIPSNRQSSSPRESVMMTQLSQQNSVQDPIDVDVLETTMQLQLDLKAEKKVTFARMMEMVKAEISSSETETSAGEEQQIKCRELAVAGLTLDHRNSSSKRKQRSWNSRRFWRSNHSNSSTQGSASDQDLQDSSLMEQMACNESTSHQSSSGRKVNRHLRLPSRSSSTGGRQASSTESLLNIIRNFSATNHRTPSTPSSPQVSDYELSSSFPTPLSTPGSPAGSLEILPSSSTVAIDNTSIQVAVIDPSVQHRSNNRSNTTNLTTPHITLEIPTVNYGQFLSPIHEVPTPLPSPAHTPIPSLRRTTGMEPSGISDSSLSSNSSTTRLERKRSQLQQQRHNYNCPPDVIYSGCDPSSICPSIQIETVGDSPDNPEQRPSISIVVPSAIQIRIESDSPPPSTLSSASNSPLPSPAKTKPPPLNIINSNFTRFNALPTAGSQTANQFRPTPPLKVPLLCVSEPSPDVEFVQIESASAGGCSNRQLQQHKSNNSLLDWGHVSLGSPPLRKVPVNAADVNTINDSSLRRAFKDTLDKSSSLDLPHPPPMITITANFSEVESDSDGGILGRGGMNNQKMCYLSPFVCYGAGRPEIATSESNLSSSGYSSMASPGPSPSCSSKTLCILEEDIALNRTINASTARIRKERRMFHRAILSPSLESSSPPPDSPETIAELRTLHIARIILPSDSEVTDDQMVDSVEPVEHESTADYESHDEGIDVLHVRAKNANIGQSLDRLDQTQSLVDPKLLTLIRTHKSTSLDSKLQGQRRNNLKSDSLDTKLLSLQPAGATSIVLQSLQLPEPLPLWVLHSNDCVNGDDPKLRGSPVSSRSESPLSDAKSVGLGRFSTHFYGMSRTDVPYTDSDGLYDYPSSETVLPPTSIHRRHARKCDRRRERKTSLKNSRIDHHHRELIEGNTPKRSFLDPGVDRGVGRLVSAKRRVRAQSNIDFCASSSSNESITSSSKNSRRKKSPRPQLINVRRGSSPICNVILTIQAASSLEEIQSEVGEEKVENEVVLDTSIELKAFKLPVRNRQGTQPLGGFRVGERRRLESGSKRREMSCASRNPQRARKYCLTTEGLNTKGATSTSSCDTETDICDSNESLANLGEIEDSVDSPLDDRGKLSHSH